MQIKNPIIYKTTNLVNGKIYVGQDSNDNKRYLGSGTLFLLSIKKYGKDNFKKEILEYCALELLNEREQYWIKELDSNNLDIVYNLTTGGDKPPLCHGRILSDETKLKISNSLKGHVVSDVTRNKIGEKHKNKKLSVEHKNKFTFKGCIVSAETKSKISNSHRGMKLSLEAKKKISESKKGRIPWNKGKKGISEETRKKMSNAAKRRHAIEILQKN